MRLRAVVLHRRTGGSRAGPSARHAIAGAATRSACAPAAGNGRRCAASAATAACCAPPSTSWPIPAAPPRSRRSRRFVTGRPPRATRPRCGAGYQKGAGDKDAKRRDLRGAVPHRPEGRKRARPGGRSTSGVACTSEAFTCTTRSAPPTTPSPSAPIPVSARRSTRASAASRGGQPKAGPGEPARPARSRPGVRLTPPTEEPKNPVNRGAFVAGKRHPLSALYRAKQHSPAPPAQRFVLGLSERLESRERTRSLVVLSGHAMERWLRRPLVDECSTLGPRRR